MRLPSVLRLSIVIGLCAGLIFAVAFGFYLRDLLLHDKNLSDRADAAVVLTGGPDRLTDAATLLATEKASALFVSGVGGNANIDDLIAVAPALAPYKSCCLVIGREARNTRGNARETAHWVKVHHYSSVIVVTSVFHLPRAMVEMHAAMPMIQFSSYRAGTSIIQQLMSTPFVTLSTIGLETIKYSLAVVRIQIQSLMAKRHTQ